MVLKNAGDRTLRDGVKAVAIMCDCSAALLMARSRKAAEGAASPLQVVWIHGLIRELNQLG
jgi:hypothetical protein